MVEQSQQLQQVVQDIALLLLHPQNVWGVERFRSVQLQFLIEGKETKLEEILDDNGDLRTETKISVCQVAEGVIGKTRTAQ